MWGAALLVSAALSASPVAAQSAGYKYKGQLAGFTPTSSHETITASCPDPAVQPCVVNVSGAQVVGTINLSFPALIPVAHIPEGDIVITPETPLATSVATDFTMFKQPISEPAKFTWHVRTTVSASGTDCDQQTPDTPVTATTFHMTQTLPCTLGALLGSFRAPNPGSASITIYVSAVVYRPGETLPIAAYLETVYVKYDFTPQGQESYVTSISPEVVQNDGEETEPLTATLTGTGFAQGATVTVGDVAVRAVRFKSATKLEVDLAGFRNLPDGARDVVVKNPDGSTEKGVGLFYVSSLVIAPLEINQGLKMDCTSVVPCVADHRTLVRARVTVNASTLPCSSLTGRLHVFEKGTTRAIAGSPFRPNGTHTPCRTVSTEPSHEQMWRAEDALNFYFNGAGNVLGSIAKLPEGSYDFVFEVSPRAPGTPPSGSGPDGARNLLHTETEKAFKTSPLGLDVYLVPQTIDALSAGVRRLASLSGLRHAFPTSSLNVTLVPTYTDNLNELVDIADSVQPGELPTPNPAHVLVLLSGLIGKEPQPTFLGLSLCGAMSGGKLDEGCKLPLGFITDPYERGEGAAHLIGHDYGLGDLYNTGAGDSFEPALLLSPLNRDKCTPPGQCFVEDGTWNGGEIAAAPSFPMRSNMGTNDRGLEDSFADRTTWEHVYVSLFPGIMPLAAQDLLVVRGSVSRSGEGTFRTFCHKTGEPPEAGSGDYSIEVQNASGQPLSSRRFSPDLSLLDTLELDALPFALHLALAPGAARVVLKHGDTVLATRTISASSPTVTLTFPNGGETLSGTATIRWSASDPDGDPLTFSLYYSANGTTWLPINIGVSGTRYDWNTALAKGTTAGRIKVVASDGFNEASATSAGTFTVAGKTPGAAILAPENGTVVRKGTAITFEGSAFDLEDGLLPASGLSFSSSRDGALGGGDSVTKTLSAGIHTITLTATDSNGNKATDAITVTVVEPAAVPDETRFVPIVLSTSGAGGSFFSSELTLTNRGTKDATVEIAYTKAFGEGAGVAYDVIPAGRQKIVPDALTYLEAHGVTLPVTGNRGGTLSAKFYGLSSSDAGAATVRTATPVTDGRAGLSYPAIAPQLLTGSATIAGLRQSTTDRSNIAVMNSGAASDGNVVLRVTVVSGDPAKGAVKAFPDVALAPGAFTQFSGVLGLNGLDLSNGYVKVERVSGAAPFFAYGVINDQRTSDGSFIPPVVDSTLAGKTGLTVPVVVETGPFSSELVATNSSTLRKTVRLVFVADAISTADKTAALDLDLAPGEQRIVPGFVQFLRSRGVAGIGPVGTTYAGALFASVPGGDVQGLVVGVRTSSAAPAGGSYGLFYTGVPFGAAASSAAWVYGLQQNGENRANLALVNIGDVDTSGSAYRIELFDGDTGRLVKTIETSLPAKRWTQLSRVLANSVPGVSNAYAKVTKTSGNNQFLAYGVINDGGTPGERSGDGAFVTMEVER